MLKYRYGLNEPIIYLMELYKQQVGSFVQEIRHNDRLSRFIEDPVLFDYDLFDEHWWPLFCFSDIGMGAMKYGRSQVMSAFERLEGEEKEKANRYIDIYTLREEPIDVTDVYHIPDKVKNPKV